MNPTRAHIVLHADDLGLNPAVTEGVLNGFRHGLLTSSSLLSNAPDAAGALDMWKRLEAERRAGGLPSLAKRQRLGDPDQPFDLGVHLNLTQGRPLTGDRYPSELLDAHGRFPGVFALFARLRRRGDRFRAALQGELEEQVRFLVDHGLKPTHLNGHQYVELLPQVRSLVPALLAKFSIPTMRVAFEPSLFRSTMLCRFQPWKWPLGWLKRCFAIRLRAEMDRLRIAHPAAFYGTVHAGCVDMRTLRCFFTNGRRFRLVEIGLHPAETPRVLSAEEATGGWQDPLAWLRHDELQLLVGDELAALMEAENLRLGRLCLQSPARSS
jgi:predicted glycoside hydrolase/deacetylase ChbG (UPF0249 family)